MQSLSGSAQSKIDHLSHRWSRIGMAGFTFFLLKGLLWLLAPVLFAVMR
ncbi:MAG: hypothetical protein NNA31_12185 [Nitrospira sp.]|nr:hypothetical protein [Nitrospira sp.]